MFLPTKDSKTKPVHTGLYLVRKGMFRGCDIPFYFYLNIQVLLGLAENVSKLTSLPKGIML